MIEQILPVFGQALLLGVLTTMLPVWRRLPFRLQGAVLATLLVLYLIVPVYGLTPGQWVRSLLGDLSVLTLIVLLQIVLAENQQGGRLKRILLPEESRIKLGCGILIVGVMFYPLSLGWGSFDPYRLGFSPLLLATALALLAMLAWFTARRVLAVTLLLPLLAFNLHLLESANLWDYLIDPLLFCYALVQCLDKLKGMRRQMNAPAQEA